MIGFFVLKAIQQALTLRQQFALPPLKYGEESPGNTGRRTS
jgi:hypothetical protein